MNSTANKTSTALPEWVYYEQIVYSGIIALIGIPGNILIILVFFYSREKSTTDYMVFSMAVNDLLGSLVCPAFNIIQQIEFVWTRIVTTWFFRFGEYLSMVTGAISTWLLGVIAIDRYMKICRPHSVVFTVSRARWTCVIVCAVVPTLSGPVFFASSYDSSPITCLIDSGCKWFILYVTIVSGSCLSFLITAVAYILVAFALGKRFKDKMRRRRHVARSSNSTAKISRPTMLTGDSNDKCINKSCAENSEYQFDASASRSVLTDVNEVFVMEKALAAHCPNEKSEEDCKINNILGMDEVLWQEQKKVNRTTVIMFLITTINIGTFILLFIGVKLLEGDSNNSWSTSMAIGYITQTAYMVNYIANPLLYMSMSSKFRESAGKLVQRQ